MNNLIPHMFFTIYSKKNIQEITEIYLSALEALQLDPFIMQQKEEINKRLHLATVYREEIILKQVVLEMSLKEDLKLLKKRVEKKELKKKIKEKVKALNNITKPIAAAMLLFRNSTDENDKYINDSIKELKRINFKVDPNTILDKWKKRTSYNTNSINYCKIVKKKNNI